MNDTCKNKETKKILVTRYGKIEIFVFNDHN